MRLLIAVSVKFLCTHWKADLKRQAYEHDKWHHTKTGIFNIHKWDVGTWKGMMETIWLSVGLSLCFGLFSKISLTKRWSALLQWWCRYQDGLCFFKEPQCRLSHSHWELYDAQYCSSAKHTNLRQLFMVMLSYREWRLNPHQLLAEYFRHCSSDDNLYWTSSVFISVFTWESVRSKVNHVPRNACQMFSHSFILGSIILFLWKGQLAHFFFTQSCCEESTITYCIFPYSMSAAAVLLWALFVVTDRKLNIEALWLIVNGQKWIHHAVRRSVMQRRRSIVMRKMNWLRVM